jgi:signal transduction histidine kinase
MRHPVDLVNAARIAVDGCTSAAQQRGIAVTLETPETRLLVLGDEQRLVQAIANLAGNGIKFTRPGGAVAVRVGQAGELAVVSVSDTGLGIPPEVLDRLFEPFWQADGSKAREILVAKDYYETVDTWQR